MHQGSFQPFPLPPAVATVAPSMASVVPSAAPSAAALKAATARAKENSKHKHSENESVRRARLREKFAILVKMLDEEANHNQSPGAQQAANNSGSGGEEGSASAAAGGLSESASSASRVHILQTCIDTLKAQRSTIERLEARLAALGEGGSSAAPASLQPQVNTAPSTAELLRMLGQFPADPSAPVHSEQEYQLLHALATQQHAQLQQQAQQTLAVQQIHAQLQAQLAQAQVQAQAVVAAASPSNVSPRLNGLKRSSPTALTDPAPHMMALDRANSGHTDRSASTSGSLGRPHVSSAASSSGSSAHPRMVDAAAGASVPKRRRTLDQEEYLLASSSTMASSRPPSTTPLGTPDMPRSYTPVLLSMYKLLSAQPCFLISPQGQMLDATASFMHVVGCESKSALLAQPFFNFLHPLEVKDTFATMQSCLQSGAGGIEDVVRNFKKSAAAAASGSPSSSYRPLRLVLFSVSHRGNRTPQMVFGIVGPPDPSLGKIAPVEFPHDVAACLAEVSRECADLLEEEQQKYLVAVMYGIPMQKLNPSSSSSSLQASSHSPSSALPPPSMPAAHFSRGPHPLQLQQSGLRMSTSRENLLNHGGSSAPAMAPSSAQMHHQQQQQQQSDALMQSHSDGYNNGHSLHSPFELDHGARDLAAMQHARPQQQFPQPPPLPTMRDAQVAQLYPMQQSLLHASFLPQAASSQPSTCSALSGALSDELPQLASPQFLHSLSRGSQVSQPDLLRQPSLVSDGMPAFSPMLQQSYSGNSGVGGLGAAAPGLSSMSPMLLRQGSSVESAPGGGGGLMLQAALSEIMDTSANAKHAEQSQQQQQQQQQPHQRSSPLPLPPQQSNPQTDSIMGDGSSFR